MKPNSSAVVKLVAVAMLSAVSGMAQAAFGNCTVSGQSGVIQSFDGTPRGTTWIAEYDPDTRAARITGGGHTACSGPVTQSANSLTLCGLTFEKRNGSSVFNYAHFSNHLGSGEGILVDTNGDGLADALELLVDKYPGAPAAVMDIPLQYYSQGTTSPTYWWLPQHVPYAPGATFNIRSDYFTPVDAQALNLVIQCPGGLTLVTSLRTGTRAGVGVGVTPIPTASFWGYAAMILLLMLAGIWMLRRRGFGNDFDLRA